MVPYHGAGNTILQKPVNFNVYTENDHFRVVPDINKDERRIANLPEELQFQIKEGKVVSAKGSRDGNQHVLEAIAKKLINKDS